MKKAFLAGVAALSVLCASAAHATITAFAFVKPTPDGFLSLRTEPKMGSRIIRRVKAGEELFVVVETTGGPWTKVETIVRNETAGKYLGAWAATRFLRVFDCGDYDD